MGAGDVRPPRHRPRGGRARAHRCLARRRRWCCGEAAAQVRRRRRRRVPQPRARRFVLCASISLPFSTTSLLRGSIKAKLDIVVQQFGLGKLYTV